MMARRFDLSKDDTLCLKGIFAVIILIHHLYQYTGILAGTPVGYVLQSLGYFGVGMFFFITGYGLMFHADDPSYRQQFLTRRFLPLYAFYAVLIVLYAAWNVLLGAPFDLSLLVQSFFIGRTYVSLGWYLQATFCMYLCYAVAIRFTRSKKQLLWCGVGAVLIYVIACRAAGLSAYWYQGMFCVALGMAWQAGEQRMARWLNEHRSPVTIGFLALFAGVYAAWLRTDLTPLLSCSTLLFVTNVLLVRGMLSHTRLMVNPVFRAWGKYSLGIYVAQGFWLLLRTKLRIHIGDPLLFAAVTVVGTSVTAVALQRLYAGIGSRIRKSIA